MMAQKPRKRPWHLFPKRLAEEANLVSGLSGLAGGAVVAGGLIIAAPVVAAAGAVITATAVGLCVYRAVPPKHFAPEDIAGRIITDFNQLDNLEPKLDRIGFIGPSRVGKTTLLSHVAAQTPPDDVTTDRVYAFVTAVAGGQAIYFTLIDGAGQEYAQQFEIIDNSDKVIIALDHNISDQEGAEDPIRVAKNEEFLKQILGLLIMKKRSDLTVHFLMNKRDRWQNAADHTKLSTWFKEQVTKWAAVPGFKVTSDFHSNFVTSDVTKIVQLLRSWSK